MSSKFWIVLVLPLIVVFGILAIFCSVMEGVCDAV